MIPACRAGTGCGILQPLAVVPLQGTKRMGMVYLGLASGALSPGYHMTGFQPLPFPEILHNLVNPV